LTGSCLRFATIQLSRICGTGFKSTHLSHPLSSVRQGES
jgi:hypothetical protein